ncbi:MAG TPA: hypothetical protein VNG53_07755 [Bacteroidia bacterium]|nr:hypothetical protein [Bacteroidia bacterium]
MGRKKKLDSSFELIEDFFDKYELKSFTENKFREVFNKYKDSWNVPSNKYASQVLAYLVIRKIFIENTFISGSNESKTIYSWKSKDEFTIISGLKSDSYFSHYSALYLHQLTLQIPKIIYLNFEHKSTASYNRSDNILMQQSIDKAFKVSQRKSLVSFSFLEKKIILINGKFTNKLGVKKKTDGEQSFEFTDIERTLIDISVRPVYAGGVFEVLEAYKRAKGKISATKLANYLTQIDFIYPYHQVIGFYMEKAGYSETEIEHFKKDMKFNFYLTYDIRNKEFSEKWKLYYPKGL